MKSKLLLLILTCPLLMFSQTENFSIEFQLSYFEDLKAEALDVNSFSSDPFTINIEDVNYSKGYQLNYHLKKSNIFAFYNDGFSEGQNINEFYQTKFEEFGVGLEYNFISSTKLTVSGSLALSKIDFNSKRYLLEHREFFISNIVDDSYSTNYGIVVSYHFNKYLSLVGKYIYYDISNDGFDGWDNNTKQDLLLQKGLSIRYIY